VTNALGHVTHIDYEHDDARRLTAVESELGERIEYTLDDLGNVTRMDVKAVGGGITRTLQRTYDDGLSNTTSHAYDALQRLVETTDRLSGVTGYDYDDRGNVVRERRTIDGVVYDTDTAWDLADNLVRVVYPSGRVVDHTRDSLGRVTAITTREVAASPAVDVATGITYQPFGPVASLTRGNCISELSQER